PEDHAIAIIKTGNEYYANTSTNPTEFTPLTLEDKKTIKQYDHNKAIDKSETFKKSISKAINHYKNTPDDHTIAKVYSDTAKIYYVNSRLDFLTFEPYQPDPYVKLPTLSEKMTTPSEMMPAASSK